MNNSKAACLIIAYRRFDQIAKYLKQGSDSGIRKFYIAVDGGKNERESSFQSAEINKILNISLPADCEIFVWQRDRNLGLAPSMISALDWFFQCEEAGVILEDDLELREDFFDFCKKGLHEFKDTSEVFSISGNQFFPFAAKKDFGNYPLIWGWATWRDRWLQVRPLYEFKKLEFGFGAFPGSPSIAGFWIAGLLRVKQGYLSSWALPFAANSRLNGWVHVYPSENLVRNVGDDKYAEHTLSLTDIALRPFSEKRLIDEFPAISNSGIEFMNHELEDKYFYIKKRHVFSPILAQLQSRISIRRRPVSLKNQLSNIDIPPIRSL